MAGDSPILDSLKRDWAQGEHAVEHWAGNLFQRQHDTPAQGADPYPQPPAQMPATMAAATAVAATPQEDPMSLAQIKDDVRTDLTDGLEWLDGFVQRVKAAAPGIISTVDTVSNTTVGKLAETLAGAIIPQQYEPMLVGLVEDFARRYGQPTVPVTDPAPTQQQPVQAAPGQ